MKNISKNENKKRSLLAQAIESLKESENNKYDINFDKLNQKLLKKTFSNNFNRNSSLKILSYNQKKSIQSLKSNNENKNYCKSFLLILFCILVNILISDNKNKTFKEDILKGNMKYNQRNIFLKNNKKDTNNNTSFNQNANLNKTQSFIAKSNINFNTLNDNTHRELFYLLEGNNTSNNINSNNINNINETNINYNAIIYENKISELETEINELKLKKEKNKNNFILFFTLIKNYSFKLIPLIKNFVNDNNNFISSNNYKEINTLLFTLNKILNNPKLCEDIFEGEELSNSFNDINNNNNINNNKDILVEYKNGVDEIITKYEKKINILNKENEEILQKIYNLEIENNLIKEQLNEEKKYKENILLKLNKLKEENNDLEKRNKILDYKCTSYFNKSTQSRYEQKNIEEEIEYKNKIIKYLESLLKKGKFNKNEEIYKKNIHKIIDLKQNLKHVKNEKAIIKDDKNKKNFSFEKLYNEKKRFIENGNNYINEKNISSDSNKSKNERILKKEIDMLDKEIEQIQSKLEIMIK